VTLGSPTTRCVLQIKPFKSVDIICGHSINDKWGEFVITPALMMGMDDIILDRISFGGVKELQEMYE
jgi:hypothetical protein